MFEINDQCYSLMSKENQKATHEVRFFQLLICHWKIERKITQTIHDAIINNKENILVSLLFNVDLFFYVFVHVIQNVYFTYAILIIKKKEK